MTKQFIVEMHGDVRELYLVEAEDEEEAKRNWASGELVLSETIGVEFYSVKEEEE